MISQDYRSCPRRTTYEKVYSYALEMFEYDKDKTNAWWLSKCEALGDKAPYELVKEGKGAKLLTLIQRCI